jgi:hypothetical protein
VVALTAAMPDGTGLSKFEKELPGRYYDTGICEGHLTAMAAGMCKSGMRPVAAIYSTFIQRAFDQVWQEVVLNKLPVVFAMDHVPGEDHTIDKPQQYAHWRELRPPGWPGPLFSWTTVRPETHEPLTRRLFDAEDGKPWWEFRRILDRIGAEIQTYVWLKTLISAATAAACYVVMKVAGLDLAEFWALLIFALNFIPYIGSWLGVIFPAFLALVQFESPASILMIVVGLTLIQFTGGSIVEPRLMGTGLNVSPVFMLLSLALWGAIWGVIGMLLAVPIMVVFMIVCSHVSATRPIAILLSADGILRS